MGSFKDRGNQYIVGDQYVPHCKLLGTGKQLSIFPHNMRSRA